jgi:hypothetical protein
MHSYFALMGACGSWMTGKQATLLICLVTLAYTVLAVQWSLRDGRLAMDPIWDDVSYLVDGLDRLNIFDQQGLTGLLYSLWVSPPHSPWSTALAFTGFALFGVNDWSPYALNGCLVVILLYGGCFFFGRSNPINRILVLSIIPMIPLTLAAVHDFRPDFAVGLFTALFALTLVWLACNGRARDNELRTYIFVGMLVGAAYLVKPSFFLHTTVMSVGAFCLAEICYRIFSTDRNQVRRSLYRLAGLVIGASLVAGPYFLVAWRQIWDYFLTNTGGGSDASIWKVSGGIWDSFRIYLVGENMFRMLGWFAPALLIWLLLGLVVSLIRKNTRSFALIICGILMSALSLCIIAVGQVNSSFFGLTWNLTFLLTAIFAIGEASRSQRINSLAIGAAVLSFVLFVLHSPTTNFWQVGEDARPESSLNYSMLKRITEIASADPPIKGPPSVFATYAGIYVNTGCQRWLSLKYHVGVNFWDKNRSGSFTQQMEQARIADFVEVADPKSKWLIPYLPSTALQGSILNQLRAESIFREMPPIVGKEGTLYLFRRNFPVPLKGFSTVEKGPPVHEWAIEPSAELMVPTAPDKADSLIISFDLLSLNARLVKISDSTGQQQMINLIPTQLRHVKMRLLPSKVPDVIKFETDTDGVKPNNGDPRTLFFDVRNLTLTSAAH